MCVIFGVHFSPGLVRSIGSLQACLCVRVCTCAYRSAPKAFTWKLNNNFSSSETRLAARKTFGNGRPRRPPGHRSLFDFGERRVTEKQNRKGDVRTRADRRAGRGGRSSPLPSRPQGAGRGRGWWWTRDVMYGQPVGGWGAGRRGRLGAARQEVA
jgi:hypothetical protein